MTDPENDGVKGPGERGDLHWGWGLTLFSLGFLVLVVVGVIVVPSDSIPAQSAVLLMAALVPAWVLLARGHGLSPAALGFHLDPRAGWETLRGLGLGLVVSLSAVAGMALVGVVRWVDDTGGAAELLVDGGAAMAFLAIPAAAEEALFRGYPLQVLSRAWGTGWALLATSVAFGALHGANPGLTAVALVNLVVAGLFLGVVYLKTGSLWLATGAHLGWNWALGYGVDLPVSGLELMDTPLWTGTSSGPSWLGGGRFGPEGSVVTTVTTLAATALAWRTPFLSRVPALRGRRLLTRLIDDRPPPASETAPGAPEGGGA